MRRTILWGLFWIIAGLAVTFLSLYLIEIQPTNATLMRISFHKLINLVGIALIGLGFFNIILQIKDWRDYFEERIKTVLFEQAYLKSLDKETLRSIQTNALKAYFKNPELDREGSFLRYFYDNLYKYISEPYREDVRAEVFLDSEEDGMFRIFDKVTYACRKTSGSIQPEIRWTPDEGEFETIENVTISVQLPYNHEDAGKVVQLRTGSVDDPNDTFTASLEKYKDVDGLIVIVESKYRIKSDRFQYWQMAHPTQNFSFTLHFPSEFTVQHKPLVINPIMCLTTSREGYLNIKYDSWMLPMSGLAWRFARAATETKDLPTTASTTTNEPPAGGSI